MKTSLCAALAMIAFCSPAWAAPDGWERGSAYNKMFNPATVTTVHGTVQSVDRNFHPMPSMGPGFSARIKTDKGESMEIEIGPAWFTGFYHKKWNIQPGDAIEVTGSRVSMHGHPVLMVARGRKGNLQAVVRSRTGAPVWDLQMEDFNTPGQALILLATAALLPRPDDESHLLLEALAGLGVPARLHAWDAPGPWPEGRTVLRSPWNYVEHLEAFLEWVDARGAGLRNPPAVVRWNCRKRYLLELAARGVATVPTLVLGEHFPVSQAEVVIKPEVGLGAIGAMRGRAEDPRLQAHARHLSRTGAVLLQPFVAGVAEGEVSLIFLEGRFSHAVREIPAAGDFRVQKHFGGRVEVHAPAADELQVARASLAVAPDETLYARVDLVRAPEGPLIMELELIEPELFLQPDVGTPALARILASL